MTMLATPGGSAQGTSLGQGPRLTVPKAVAAQHIRAHIQRGIAIRRQRIRYIEDLEDVRALKGEWVTSYTETLKQLFSHTDIADECNDWIGKVYPEFSDVSLFVEAFYEEMDYRIQKLRTVLKRLEDMGEYVPRTITGQPAGPNGEGGAGGGTVTGGVRSGPIMPETPPISPNPPTTSYATPAPVSSPMAPVRESMAPVREPMAPLMTPTSAPTTMQSAPSTVTVTVTTPSPAPAPASVGPKSSAPAPKASVTVSHSTSGATSSSSSSSSSSNLSPPPAADVVPPLNTGIFVVHGDLQPTVNTINSFMDDLGIRLQPLPAHPERAKGLVNSLEKNPDASFALVLLGHDDAVALRRSAADASAGVRSGIVFELGYFVGRLGLKRVCVLYTGGSETFISDHGIQFIPIDSGNGWQLQLARHLKRAGIEVDLNKLF